MFNLFKRKTQLDVITQHFKEEGRVKDQCDTTIHAALFARYMTVTRMTALAQWAKMSDAEKMEACNIEPEAIPLPPAKVKALKQEPTSEELGDRRAERAAANFTTGLHAN